MGLVAREIEKRGIPTICISSAYDITHAVRPPRAVFLNFPLNHQTGKPNDPALQTQILRDTFRAFETLSAPGQILTLPYVWDPNDASWEQNDYGPGFELYGVGTPLPGQEKFPEHTLRRAERKDAPQPVGEDPPTVIPG